MDSITHEAEKGQENIPMDQGQVQVPGRGSLGMLSSSNEHI